MEINEKSWNRQDRDIIFDNLSDKIRNLNRKIIVLDDDPTGTQTVHDVIIYTDWQEETITEAFSEDNSIFYILTNSRALSEDRSREVHKEIAENIMKASEKTGIQYLVYSRSDSTLRGHYPLEVDVLKEILTEQYKIDGEVFIPFFGEGGRITYQDVHYVQQKNQYIPVGETEYAGDKDFAFSASNLREYMKEKSLGKIREEQISSISLESIRSKKYNEIMKVLLEMNNEDRLIVNALEYMDLAYFSLPFIDALLTGKNFIIRGSASFAAVLGNRVNGYRLSGEEIVNIRTKAGGLTVVGSYVGKTTVQLSYVIDHDQDIMPICVDPADVIGSFDSLEKIRCISDEISNHIVSGKDVVLYTTRTKLSPDDFKGFSSEELSEEISNMLVSIVTGISCEPRYLIAKGGITSSDLVTKAMKVRKARVIGQIEKGIPVWVDMEEEKGESFPMIIFPGNVGDEDTLFKVITSVKAIRLDKDV